MKEKELTKALYILMIIGLIALSVVYFTHIKARLEERRHLFELKNAECQNLTAELNKIYSNFTYCMELYNDTERCSGNYTIHCYYAQCPTEKEILEKTQPLCVCDFTKDNITFTVCIRQA